MKLLIVDDFDLVGRSLGRAFREHDVTVLTSALIALRNIQDGTRYHVIVCDVLMPEMDGLALLDALLEIAPDQAARMIFMCGGSDAIAETSYIRSLPNPVFEKPVDIAALRRLIAKMART